MKRDPPKPPHDSTARLFWWYRNTDVVAAMAPSRRKWCERRRHQDNRHLVAHVEYALGQGEDYEQLRALLRLASRGLIV
jgi:hypothetical protein